MAAALTASSSTCPDTIDENIVIAMPNGINFFAKSSMSFSPAKNPASPPLFGIVSAISVNNFPQLAAAETASSSTLPDTTAENAANAIPKGINCCANSVSEEPPVNHEVTPLRTSAAVRISIVSANVFTPFIISSVSIDAPTINGVAFSINDDNSFPKSANEDP